MAIPKEWWGIHPDFVAWARIDATVDKTFGKRGLASPSWLAFAPLTELLFTKMQAEGARGEDREAAYEAAKRAVAAATADQRLARTYEDIRQSAKRLRESLLQSLRPRLMEFPNAERMAERHLAKSMKKLKDKLEGKDSPDRQQLL